MVAFRSNRFFLFVILRFANSVIGIASNFRSDVKVGRRDTGGDSSSSDEVSEGSEGSYCFDTSEYFTVESLGIKMRCDDLKRQNDRNGRTASKIREKVRRTFSNQNCSRVPTQMLPALISNHSTLEHTVSL